MYHSTHIFLFAFAEDTALVPAKSSSAYQNGHRHSLNQAP